jgi:hypothetical protein
MIWNSIYDFCKVRNSGTVYNNGFEFTPRFQWIVDTCIDNGLNPIVQTFEINEENTGFNLVLKGTSNKWISAHHDVANHHSDNANDNSCSVVNAISAHLIDPSINIVITDGEEFGGLGAIYFSNTVEEEYGKPEFILNLELTGRGADHFLLDAGSITTELGNRITDTYENASYVNVPFSDAVIFRSFKFNAVTINPLPLKDNKMDMSVVYLCHSMRDCVDLISIEDMERFTTEYIVPICK